MDQTLANTQGCNPACRACHYKDRPYSEQLVLKNTWANQRLAPWADKLQSIRPAPPAEQLSYRSKTWLRSHVHAGELSLGMYRAVRAGTDWIQEFVSWDSCPLHSKAILDITATLKKELMGDLTHFTENSLFGVWLGAPHVVLVARDADLTRLRQIKWGSMLSAPFDQVWVHQTNQVGKKIFQHREFHSLYGDSPRSEHPILAFRQNAQTLLRHARDLALGALLEPQPLLILDLYCGTGDIAEALPESVGWLGIELSGDAVAYANQRRRGNAVHQAWVGTVEHRLLDPAVTRHIPANYSLYLNPPRPGLSPEAREVLVNLLKEKRAGRIVYLSCSASSLARDLTTLTQCGYSVRSLQPFDFFPQTEHFETLAILEPDAR